MKDQDLVKECHNWQDDFKIFESGLFNSKSRIPKETKLKMVDWYNNLSEEEKQFVDDLRHEAVMDEWDANAGAEL